MKIEIRKLCFGYLKRPLSVVDFSCDLEAGKPVAVLGGEGAGKTSLLRVLSGLENQYAGHIFVCDNELMNISVEERNFTYLPSSPVLLDRGTIETNFKFLYKTLNKGYNEKEVLSALKKFGFNKPLTTKIKKLSSCEKKLITIIRAYIKAARVLLIDDMFEGEDENSANILKTAILMLINANLAKKCVFYVENPKYQLNLANIYKYLSYGKMTDIRDINSLKNNPVDLYSFDYFESFKEDFWLKSMESGYYLIQEEKLVTGKGRKAKTEFIEKKRIKIDQRFNGLLSEQKLEENEQMEVTLASFRPLNNLSDERINEGFLSKKIFLFDKNTLVKLL